MFTRLVRSRIGSRRYSTSPSGMSKSFDKTMYYPAFLLVLLGSQVINVMNAQRKVEDLERRYTMKMEKINEIIRKVKDGQHIDIEKEMELVNKVFERQGSYSVMGNNAVIGHIKKEEELVLREDMDDLTEEKLASLFGLDAAEPVEKKKAQKPLTREEPSEIKVNRSEIDAQMRKEKELLSYKIEPETHLIVENPGEYVDAAKDTKVRKFL